MATTTPNFGWTVPTSTDLVKDGATAIETLGDSIDASFVDLKGGTTGQFLAKASGTDLDFTWSTPSISFVGVSVKATTNQSISNSTFTAVTWDSEYYDTNTFHSTSSNTSRFTIPAGKAGYYAIIGRLDYAANATGNRRIAVYKNGVLIQGSVFVAPAGGFEISNAIQTILSLAVSDYVEIYAWQNSGGALDLYKTGGESEFTMAFLGA